ncbi:LacI family DNA-binding transcriptional regulator [Gandjariella thermophila]|uniref:LacI family transcriptional regulator n=1 Tax=Gandjariella thermophila TaxID=1931992 RepID=A0A4D4J549_9PSEU|nr:LacI family DNA-binding transcriptional regulator [Gandjariella thermophila]GDY29666.1 LacI family transcriptional regulator [Gandjariella thermophila]
MATISDVAARAGVSPATVSRVLNGKSTVDPGLAERVVAAARELDYRPNAFARNLRRQASTVLALIIADVENPFFTAIARGVEDVAQASGYSVVLCNADDDPAKERRYVDVALAERAAGVIISPAGVQTDVGALLEQSIPVVAVDRPLAAPAGDTVLVDTRLAARQATLHLVEAGYHRIACVTGPSGVRTADDRLAGYRDGLRAAKRRSSAALVRRADYRAAGAQRATRDLFDRPERPDALLVANNAMAIGALQALAELGLRPGTEVGVVSFDDAPWAPLVVPSLTVVSQPAYEMGMVAAQLLLARIADGSREPTTTTLSAQLIERDSSRRG